MTVMIFDLNKYPKSFNNFVFPSKKNYELKYMGRKTLPTN